MAEIFDFYVNDNRSITFKLSEPIMLEDNGVSDWRFHIPNIVNGLDATGWAWWLVYVNAKNEKYTIPLTLEYDYDRPDAYSIATYTVDYGMSCKVGNIKFSLEAIDADTGGTILHEWHTRTYSSVKVENTLQGNQVEYAETESDIISALLIEVQNKINQLTGGATPLPVSSISEMVDTAKVYILTTDKNWYYYNGSAWVSGGLYASGIVIDPTFTKSGQAADAKETGDKIARRVSKPVSSPNGIAGQLLRTNGDGTTQWVDQGLPTDEQTAEAIDAWLTDHPEATTTVQDGSLTYKKLVTGTLGFVTPEMFGAVGDGVTNDTQALQSMFDYVAANISNKPVICVGRGKYLTDRISINTPLYEYKNIALLEGLHFIAKDSLLFTGTSNNHYGFVFNGCRFEVADGVSDCVMFKNYLFTNSSFNNCYFNAFKNVVYGDVFIQQIRFSGCAFENCEIVFYATGVYTLTCENCIFEYCSHIFEQALLNPNTDVNYRWISRLTFVGCYFNHYTDYAIKAICFSDIHIEKTYFENGQGAGHGVITDTDENFTRENRLIVITGNTFQMSGTSTTSPKMFVPNGEICNVNMCDNMSYNAYLADITHLTVSNAMNFERNYRQIHPQNVLATSYASLKNVYAPDFNRDMVNYKSINGAMYQVEVVGGNVVLSRVVSTTIPKGEIRLAAFNFTDFTDFDISKPTPYDYYNQGKILNCYNDNGYIRFSEIGLSDSFVASENRVGIMFD